MILDILSEKCHEEGLTKFKQLLFMMLANFRLGQNIADLAINLSKTRVDVEINNYLYEKSKGNIASFIKCAECNVYLWRGNIEEIKYFNCNHIYHKVCFLKKEINDECYICKRNDCIVERNKNNYFDKEKQETYVEEMRKKEEEKNRKKKRKEKLNQLKRINKKKRELNEILNKNNILNEE